MEISDRPSDFLLTAFLGSAKSLLCRLTKGIVFSANYHFKEISALIIDYSILQQFKIFFPTSGSRSGFALTPFIITLMIKLSVFQYFSYFIQKHNEHDCFVYLHSFLNIVLKQSFENSRAVYTQGMGSFLVIASYPELTRNLCVVWRLFSISS